jgi:V/A-type H+/Na+-transporting ATPase subunit I
MQRAMTRLYVLYSRDREQALVRALQRLGVLHIEPIPELPRRTLADSRHELEELLLKVKGLEEALTLACGPQTSPGPYTVPPQAARRTVQTKSGDEGREDLDPHEIRALEEQVRRVLAERRHIQERLDAATRVAPVLEVVARLLQEVGTRPGWETVVGLGSSEIAHQEIVHFLERTLPGRCLVRVQQLPERRWVLVAAGEGEYAPAMREYLESKGIRPLALPTHIPSTLPLPEAIAQLQRELAEGPARLRELDRALSEIAQTQGARVRALARSLENRIAQLNALERFGYTEYTLLISGWVPADEYDHFVKKLTEQFPGIIVRQDPQPAPPEEIPVALKNNAWARPYELFLSIMGVPRYGTVDPVPLVSFFFPLFFGIIVGDMGYGAVIALVGLWLRRRFAHSELIKSASQIVLHCALSTIFFGAIFAELFGFILPYPHFSRGEQIDELLLFSVALGATQILLGFALGAINALRERHKKHAVAKIAAIGALVGLGLSVGTLAGQLPEVFKTPSFALLAVAILLLVMSEGLIGVLELVSYVGNIISYARLMGFGLVGLKIAELINEAGHALHNVFLAVLIGIVAHAANLGLALFEATVQSARLHYVEFFQKFLELGGRKYEPFREI